MMNAQHRMPDGSMMAGRMEDMDSLYADAEQEQAEPESIQVDSALLPEAEAGDRFTFEVAESLDGKVGLRLVPEPEGDPEEDY